VPTVLNSLPYGSVPLYLRGKPWRKVLPHQIFVWVSVTPPGVLWDEFPTKPDAFPALLDTGCNHNFSIREEDLYPCSGLYTAHLPQAARRPERPINGVQTPFFEADLWIYHNKPGRRDELLDVEPFHIELPGGIGVYRPNDVRPDKPPLLGLQALDYANCHLLIDCDRRLVSLRTNKPLIIL
jgi:hypothetical protein